MTILFLKAFFGFILFFAVVYLISRFLAWAWYEDYRFIVYIFFIILIALFLAALYVKAVVR